MFYAYFFNILVDFFIPLFTSYERKKTSNILSKYFILMNYYYKILIQLKA